MTTSKARSASRPARDPVLCPIGIACGVAAAIAFVIYFAPLDWERWDLAWLPAKAQSFFVPMGMLSIFFVQIDRQGRTRLLVVALLTGLYAALAFTIWRWFAVSPAILIIIGLVLAIATSIAIFEHRLKRRVAAMGEKQVWPDQALSSRPVERPKHP